MKALTTVYLHMTLEIIFRLRASNAVHILSENFDQLVTSSTLQWVPYHTANETTLKYSVVASYHVTQDVSASEKTTNDRLIFEPLYVCRAKIKGIWCPGHMKLRSSTCVVSMFTKVMDNPKFDLLMSIEGRSRVSWQYLNKYQVRPRGSVASEEGVDNRQPHSFVARRNSEHHNKTGSFSHYVGRYFASDTDGNFFVVYPNNTEGKFSDGEILVETEPVRYVLKKIRFDLGKQRITNSTEVSSNAVMSNLQTDGESQMFKAVLVLNYTRKFHWGKGHGLLTGQPFKIQDDNYQGVEYKWSLPAQKDNTITETANWRLAPGTAVNVTLHGTINERDTPYQGTVVAHFEDGETRNGSLADSLVETVMDFVRLVYGPVYYVENGTLVPDSLLEPTTITTSTSSTSNTDLTLDNLRATTATESSTTDRDSNTKSDRDDNTTTGRNNNNHSSGRNGTNHRLFKESASNNVEQSSMDPPKSGAITPDGGDNGVVYLNGSSSLYLRIILFVLLLSTY